MLTTSVNGRVYDYNRVVGGRAFRGLTYAAVGDNDDVFVVTRDQAVVDILKLTIGSDLDDEELITSFRDGREENFDDTWPTCISVFAGLVYLTDELNSQILVFDGEGNKLSEIGEPGEGLGQFNRPSGISISSDGCIYVSDTLNNRIQKFSLSGEHLGGWGSHGQGIGEFDAPWGISVGPDGAVYVSDHKNHRIQKFDQDGNLLLSFGEYGAESGQLDHPSDVSVDSDGDIYVSDWANNRIQIFGAEGDHIANLTGSAIELSKWQRQYVNASPDVYKARRRVASLEPETFFALPTCVEFDKNKSRLLAVDSQRWRIQVFDKVNNYGDPQFNI